MSDHLPSDVREVIAGLRATIAEYRLAIWQITKVFREEPDPAPDSDSGAPTARGEDVTSRSTYYGLHPALLAVLLRGLNEGNRISPEECVEIDAETTAHVASCRDGWSQVTLLAVGTPFYSVPLNETLSS